MLRSHAIQPSSAINQSINLKRQATNVKSVYKEQADKIKDNIKKLLAKNYDNLKLFPAQAGPHYVYTLDGPEQHPVVCTLRDSLKQRLLKKFLSYPKNNIYYELKTNDEVSQVKKVKKDREKINEVKRKISTNQYELIPGIKMGNKYKKYSYEFKKSIIKEIQEALEDCGSSLGQRQRYHKEYRKIIRDKSKEYRIHMKNIMRWIDNKQMIGQQSGRKPKFPKLQDQLMKFISDRPKSKRKDIIDEAKIIMQIYYPSVKIGKDCDFNFSKGWYQRFKTRIRRKQENLQRQMNTLGQNIENPNHKIFMMKSENSQDKQQEFSELQEPSENNYCENEQFQFL